NGKFSLVRMFRDSLNLVKDELNNDGFVRYVNGEITVVPDSMAIRYSNSVNSVHYFSVLPYGLKDEAVNLKYLDSVNIKGNKYHKIQVSFDQEGGGVDYEDIFIYWINTKTNHIDYLGYTYYTDDGGMRFREAYNPRVINGIRFADYRNYKPKDSTLLFSKIDSAFENDELELLSTVDLENISVN
ncbi:MAG: DUF6503 family protein, partial [Flavobacteriaceae bacterium]|nr:DUF6503 family protein [Flavobacteriaceae bacterium]